MRKKTPLNKLICLPDHYTGNIAKSFQRETDETVLQWDFSVNVSSTIKLQIETLLNYIVKNIKSRDERKQKYLLPLQYLFRYAEKHNVQDILQLETYQEKEYKDSVPKEIKRNSGSLGTFIGFCRRVLFLSNKEIDWSANVWYVEKLQINPKRKSQGNNILSFSFLDIKQWDNRKALQQYIKYLIYVTDMNINTIRIRQSYAREFMKYLEEHELGLSDVNYQVASQYIKKLGTQQRNPKSHNIKLKVITGIIQYMQVTDYVPRFEIPVNYYEKKEIPTVNEIFNIEEKLDILQDNLYRFPEELRIMCLILIYTGIEKGQMLSLKCTDFYWDEGTSWMRVPKKNRRIPVPDMLYWIIIRYVKRNHLSYDRLLFLNERGKNYSTASFANVVSKHCHNLGILDGEYIFKGSSYQRALCRVMHRGGSSLQTIRDYMGYRTEEVVKDIVGWRDEKVAAENEKFFRDESHNLGGKLLMAKYDRMKEINRLESLNKVDLAIQEIRNCRESGREVSVTELSRKTGLSKGFFYKNEKVREALEEVKNEQKEEQWGIIRKEIIDHSLEKQLEVYRKELDKTKSENQRLQKENEELKKALDKQTVEYLKLLSET